VEDDRPRSLVYIPKRRTAAQRAFDAVAIFAVVAATVTYARRTEIGCAWVGQEAVCHVVEVSPLGTRRETVIGGIRGVAYRSGTRLGLVTSARNKDELAAFGTRDIGAWDEDSTLTLRQFFDEGAGAPLHIATGPERPFLWTLALLLGLLVYATMTRPQAFIVTIDPRERLLRLRRRSVVLGAEERWELSRVRGFDVENAEAGRHRVRLELEGGRRLPLTEGFFKGTHHHEFTERVREALAGVRSP
jgi:hypothetical protein